MHEELYRTTTELKHTFRKERDARLTTCIRELKVCTKAGIGRNVEQEIYFCANFRNNYIEIKNS